MRSRECCFTGQRLSTRLELCRQEAQAPVQGRLEALLGQKACSAQGGLHADHFLYGLAFTMVCLANVRAGGVTGRLHRAHWG